jgi:hypothetical protein
VAALLLAYLPVIGAGATLLQRATGSETPGMILAALWMLAYAGAGHRVASFPCPSCGEPFHYERRRAFPWGMWRPRSPRCVHCGLPKWHAPPGKRAR